jgi:hypothetical protein
VLLHVDVLDAGFYVRFTVRSEAQFLVKADRVVLGAKVDPLKAGSPGVLNQRKEGFCAQPQTAVLTQHRQAPDMPVGEHTPGGGEHTSMPDKDVGSGPVLSVKIDAFVYALLACEDRVTYAPDFGGVAVVKLDNDGPICHPVLPPRAMNFFSLILNIIST